MRGDAPDARADREGDLDLLVDGGLIAAGAQAAMIVVRTQRFQRGVGAEHAAATGAQHIPGQIEQPEPRGVQKARDHPLFVEPGPLRKIQHVDAVELMVLARFRSARRMASATAGSVVCLSSENCAWMSLMCNPGQIRHASPSDACVNDGVMANIGERSGCVVTTPTGITGALSTSVTRNAPIILASASTASTSAKCAPMQTRAPTPNGR